VVLLRETAARACVLGTLVGALFGCPQLLDDDFAIRAALPRTGLDSGDSDAGAGGPASGAGSGGASDTDGSSGSGAGGTAGSAARPDAGGDAPFEPLTEIGGLLVHRYRFEGSGSTVLDSVGTAHGTTVGASLSGSGKVGLSGTNQYVDLPDGILSSLSNATLEAWLNWQTASFSAEALDTTSVLPTSADPAQGTQVVLVASTTRGSLELYLDGARIGSTPAGQDIDLSAITDLNNWLGRSQYSGDPGFRGEFLDFRIYGSALTSEQVSQSFALGADAQL